MFVAARSAAWQALAEVFQKAYEEAKKITRPFVVSARLGNGETTSAIGAWVLVNEEWGVTASHIIENANSLLDQTTKWAEYTDEMAKVDARNLAPAKRKRAVGALKKKYRPNTLAANVSIWLGHDAVHLLTGGKVHVNKAADLAAIRLGGIPGAWVDHARFRSGEMKPGTSILRYGYPFHDIPTTYDPATKRFDISAGVPVPVFPSEGITTRRVIIDPKGPDGFPIELLETSSPGLLGQSGGPLLDTEGTVWAIQSKTKHLELGFNAEIKKGKSKTKYPQFLNAGMGADAVTIRGFLDSLGIQYQTN